MNKNQLIRKFSSRNETNNENETTDAVDFSDQEEASDMFIDD